MNAFAAKYHVGRYVVWTVLCSLIVGLAMAGLYLLFDPPYWLVIVGAGVLGVASPNPKWVKR